LTYLDISGLSQGLHTVEVKMPSELYRNNLIATIPFYKEIPVSPYIIPDKEASEENAESYLKLKPILSK
jgi:hypothetical protein